MVDDFGVKYRNKKDADHPISSLQAKYEVTQCLTGVLYCGIKLKWNHITHQLDISMPVYVKDALHKFQHLTPTRPHHSPYQWTAPQYRSTMPQLEHPEDDSLSLNPDKANTVQLVVRTLLYYAHAVEPTILVFLSTIASQQLKSTKETKKVVQLLDYEATHPEAITRYHASGITLYMHSDASFVLAAVGKIRAGGYHYLSELSSEPKRPPHKPRPINVPIHVECKTIINVLASTTEAELGALFVNCHSRTAMRIALE